MDSRRMLSLVTGNNILTCSLRGRYPVSPLLRDNPLTDRMISYREPSQTVSLWPIQPTVCMLKISLPPNPELVEVLSLGKALLPSNHMHDSLDGSGVITVTLLIDPLKK